MAHAFLYMHQSSGVCPGVCVCNCTHQMEKNDTVEILFNLYVIFKLLENVIVSVCKYLLKLKDTSNQLLLFHQ